jgi:hypothetical protein
LLHWAPTVCWVIGGAMLVALSMTYLKRDKPS